MSVDEPVYAGRYPVFDRSRLEHYPLAERRSRAEVGGFLDPRTVPRPPGPGPSLPWFRDGRPGGNDQSEGLSELARRIASCVREGKPVIALCGAHFIKNGLSPLVIDLMRRGAITLLGCNFACAIHSFEFALTGASSESVRENLPNGRFGMAFETDAYLTAAMELGAARGLGLGESMGLLYCDAQFRAEAIDRALSRHPANAAYITPYNGFPHEESCVFAAGYRLGVPVCVHPSIGTDIVDQYRWFDGAFKGRTGGFDFLILVEQVRRCTGGGVILAIGSAITGPEVALKAVSMAANGGYPPSDLWTADFDLRPFAFGDREDEQQPGYYFRDQKSIVSRIPASFGGVGFYFQGPHQQTLPALYAHVLTELEGP